MQYKIPYSVSNLHTAAQLSDIHIDGEIGARFDRFVHERISGKFAIDEIYSNIVRYSGATEATVSIEKANNTLKLYFKDNGKPYNPLDAKDPDITASAEDRNIGGLGVFMVKKMLDNVEYKYVDNFNILTLTKNLD